MHGTTGTGTAWASGSAARTTHGRARTGAARTLISAAAGTCRARTLKDGPSGSVGCARSGDVGGARPGLRHHHTPHRRCGRRRRGRCGFGDGSGRNRRRHGHGSRRRSCLGGRRNARSRGTHDRRSTRLCAKWRPGDHGPLYRTAGDGGGGGRQDNVRRLAWLRHHNPAWRSSWCSNRRWGRWRRRRSWRSHNDRGRSNRGRADGACRTHRGGHGDHGARCNGRRHRHGMPGQRSRRRRHHAGCLAGARTGCRMRGRRSVGRGTRGGWSHRDRRAGRGSRPGHSLGLLPFQDGL